MPNDRIICIHKNTIKTHQINVDYHTSFYLFYETDVVIIVVK